MRSWQVTCWAAVSSIPGRWVGSCLSQRRIYSREREINELKPHLRYRLGLENTQESSQRVLSNRPAVVAWTPEWTRGWNECCRLQWAGFHFPACGPAVMDHSKAWQCRNLTLRERNHRAPFPRIMISMLTVVRCVDRQKKIEKELRYRSPFPSGLKTSSFDLNRQSIRKQLLLISWNRNKFPKRGRRCGSSSP